MGSTRCSGREALSTGSCAAQTQGRDRDATASALALLDLVLPPSQEGGAVPPQWQAFCRAPAHVAWLRSTLQELAPCALSLCCEKPHVLTACTLGTWLCQTSCCCQAGGASALAVVGLLPGASTRVAWLRSIPA